MIKIREKKEQAEGNIQMEAQKPAHISRDLFCDWQEGKLGTPEETDFFTHSPGTRLTPFHIPPFK